MIWGRSSDRGLRLAENEVLDAELTGVYLHTDRVAGPGILYVTNHRLVFINPPDRPWEALHQSAGKVRVDRQIRAIGGRDRISVELGQQWVCSICSFVNAAQAGVCATCGVPMQDDATQLAEGADALADALQPGECPQCTFRNHPSLTHCEMCGASIVQQRRPGGRGYRLELPQKEHLSRRPTDMVLSVLGRDATGVPLDKATASGPSTSAAASIASSSSSHAASPAPQAAPLHFGMKKLHRHAEAESSSTADWLRRAMESSDGFVEAAPHLAQLASTLSAQKGDHVVFGDVAELFGPEWDFGRAVPAVPGATDATGMARELADLLIGQDELARRGGVVTLHDLLALYNRSRGMAFVGPEELLAALAAAERLDLALRCRTLSSGLRVVETRGGQDRAMTRLLRWIEAESRGGWREAAGFSARDVGEQFGYSVQIAAEELATAEAKGLLCRDENISGLRFFPNLIKASTESS